MPSAVWGDDRCASMRYLAKANLMLGRRGEARNWHLRAIAQAPHLREPYLDFARQLYEEEEWDGVLYFTRAALAIRERPPDLYHRGGQLGQPAPRPPSHRPTTGTGRLAEALQAAQQALAISPGDPRLAGNVACLERQLARKE